MANHVVNAAAARAMHAAQVELGGENPNAGMRAVIAAMDTMATNFEAAVDAAEEQAARPRNAVKMQGIAIPKFAGGCGGAAGTAIREWTEAVDRAGVATGMEEDQLASYAIASLEGDAMSFINNVYRFGLEDIAEWEDLKRVLLAEYDKPLTSAEKVEYIATLKMKSGETSSAFWARGVTVHIQCNMDMIRPNGVPEGPWPAVKRDITMAAVLNTFIDGLPQRWKDALISRGIHEPDEVRRAVMNLEQCDLQAAKQKRATAPVTMIETDVATTYATPSRGGGGRGRGRGRGRGGRDNRGGRGGQGGGGGAGGTASGATGGATGGNWFNPQEHGCFNCGSADHWQRDCTKSGAKDMKISEYQKKMGISSVENLGGNKNAGNGGKATTTVESVSGVGAIERRQQDVSTYTQQPKKEGGAFYDRSQSAQHF
jgi:uncharacterized membrane protein YgcG